MKRYLHLLILSLISVLFGAAQLSAKSEAFSDSGNRQLAFPGAEGYGRFAKGGRGGDVYHVTFTVQRSEQS